MKTIKKAMIFTFDTCTSRCAYCRHATTGSVLDRAQLEPYRSAEFIDAMLHFFEKRSNDSTQWLLMMLGGEPLLMPNLPYFMDRLAEHGNKAAFYTSLNMGKKHPAIRYLLSHGAEQTDYIMASFHPESDAKEDAFFDILYSLKQAGHKVVFRFVAHPKRLDRMPVLAERCERLDISFSPYAYTSANYPKGYTAEQRALIESYTSNFSQVIQLENGLNTEGLECEAGEGLLYVNARDGRIFPCPNVFNRSIGNIYDNFLERKQGRGCYDPSTKCFCDVNFQQKSVMGIDDSQHFEAEKNGYVKPKDHGALKEALLQSGVAFYDKEHHNSLGQDSSDDLLVLSRAETKKAFLRNKPANNYHETFRKHLIHSE